MENVWWFIGGVTLLLSLVLMRRKPEQQVADRAELFRKAKEVLEDPQVDPDTGELYAYKITRVSAEAKLSDKPPTIIEPTQRKSRAS